MLSSYSLPSYSLPSGLLDELPPWLPLSVFAWAVQEVVFHAAGYAFEYCDRHGLLRQFKVRDTDRKAYASLLPKVLVNQVFVLLPAMMAAEYAGFCFAGPVRQLPASRFLLSLPAMAVGHDVVQYATHRFLLHQPLVPLMRLLRHSVHHSTGATKAVSACYMAPPDFFLEIVLPYLLPLALVGGGGRDVLFHALIAGTGAIGGLYEHSGYDFSLLAGKPANPGFVARWPGVARLLRDFLDNRAHSEHHVRANVSFSDGFGSPGICDTLFGTRWDLVAKHRHEEAEHEWQQQRAGLS